MSEEVKTTKGLKEKGLSKPESFLPPEVLYKQLKDTLVKYHPSSDLTMVEKAYQIAYKAHEGQKRKSGEPYIIHPINVAIILAELELDKETIVAGILHDVVEDTVMTSEEIAAEFSDEIALLVDGVTKLTQLDLSQDKIEIQAENLRKMFLAMAKDIRVILIKLADRLHNLRTMQFQSPAKQLEKCRETMDIYAPIAHRLGISKIKIELDDLSMMYLYPDVYKSLKEDVDTRMHVGEGYIHNMVEEVRGYVEEGGIDCEVDGRVKHLFSIYKKMITQNKTLDQIYDIHAIRIKVNTVRDCYAALGVIHEKYTPIPGRFKDYIAMPKQNMYQSLHTTLIGPNGRPFEIQIRTYEMHKIAEYGIAAHWKYKEGKGDAKNNEEQKLSWLRQILEWQTDMTDNREFMSNIKTDLDLFSDQVYCFTPAGDVKSLRKGSTPIDFAYSIHTAVGNKLIGARVNGRQVPIETVLQNGDRVEIITSQNSKGPSRDWLKIVKSTQARTKINQWFRNENKEDNIQRGKDAISNYCKAKSIILSEITKPEFIENVIKKYNFAGWEAVLASIGHGGLKEGQVVNRLLEEYKQSEQRKLTDEQLVKKINEPGRGTGGHGSGVRISGMDGIAIRLSKCCAPVPGDEIIGYITRGRGASVHRTDCVNILCMDELDRERLKEAEWISNDAPEKNLYTTEINVYAYEGNKLIFEISKIFNEVKITLTGLNVRTSRQGKATITIRFEISSKEQLNKIIAKIRNIEGVIDIERTTG